MSDICIVSDTMPTASSRRTTVRWDDDEHEWLERAAALRADGKVGTVVRALVREAMGRDEVAVIAADLELRAGVAPTVVVGTVPRGAAPVPPSGAAPRAAARRVRLEVVVARVLEPRGGQIAPVTLAAARRKIRAGEVEVSGRGAAGLDPGLLVGPGEVVVR